MQIKDFGPSITDESAAKQIEIQAKYLGYLQRQEKEIERLKHS